MPKYCDITAIRIGFELPGYTYMEPMFEELIDQFYSSPTGLPVNGPIYLVKENNVISEQTFLVSIQVEDSGTSSVQPATFGVDYYLGTPGRKSVAKTFLASEQRIAFQFTLFSDTIPEGTEIFQARVFPEKVPMWSVRSVERFPMETLASEIFVVIEDDDERKFAVLTVCISSFVIIFSYCNWLC